MLSDRVASAAETERAFRDGEAIVREGEPGREMFVVLSGEAVVRRNGNVLARLHKGQFFGEMAVLESLPRDADVFARGDTRVQVLGPGALLVRLRRDPSFGLEIMHALSTRLRALNERLDGKT
jgi:CRP-like cAMP-binding protein